MQQSRQPRKNKEQRPVKSGNADDAGFLMKMLHRYNRARLWNGCSSSSTRFKRNG